MVDAIDNLNGKAEKFNKRASAGYKTAGYWFDKFLPHVTASQTKWNTGTVTGTQDLYSLGFNYKVQEGIMFKSNIGYSISYNGPAHMEREGDVTTAAAGFDVVFQENIERIANQENNFYNFSTEHLLYIF